MKKIILGCFVIAGLFANVWAIVSPKDGGKLPQAFYDARASDKNAFRLQRAWINKVKGLKAEREFFINTRGINGSSELPRAFKVSGNFDIPVVLGNFANTSIPYPYGNLQTELFNGPWPSGTMAEYYSEISYGNINLTGTVYNWVTVSGNDTYYEGTSNGLSPGNAHTGEFIKEIVDALDGGVDFGIYDNDGPDGIPNSGDDDGYVDFIAIVHPEVGAECGGNLNIWSHSWAYRAWPIGGYQPYTTNDASALGGNILIDDYVIQPAMACGGTTMIQIGVFCHEFGHAFGLPDLYDIDGGSSGIGHWGLMGSGNWNMPDSPSHMSAWSKVQLGWIVPSAVTWQGAVQSIPEVETNAFCYQLPFSDDRFRRGSECALSGSFSMRCALSSSEATDRNWKSGTGYGNEWNEVIARDFTFDGTTPVNLAYDYSYEMETDYDYGYAIIDIGGSETILTIYNGEAPGGGPITGSENFDLSPILSSYNPPFDYKIKFRFTSDYAYSDEDGFYSTTCGAIIIDNLTLTGGSENYSTGFENYIDGWYQDPSANPSAEYWLAENRDTTGFDINLHNPGLLIWHCDDEVMNSFHGNTGGGDSPSDRTTRGVVLEEADGNENLLTGANRGDGGDSYPGSSNNVTFDSASIPSSNNNSGRTTMIEVSSISAPAMLMSAYLQAGDPAPIPSSVTPDSIDNDLISVDVTIDGFKMRHGASFKFTKPGEQAIVPASIDWVGLRRITGNLNVYSKSPGSWNLVVTNPDGQVDSVPGALYLNFKVATKLSFAQITAIDAGIEIKFRLSDLDDGEKIVVNRSSSMGGRWSEPVWAAQEINRFDYRYLDGAAIPGRTYYYRIEAHSVAGEVAILFSGSAEARAGKLVLYQNYPNPFNPSTTISFYLPEGTMVNLEIYDVNGRHVKTLAEGALYPVGLKEVQWDGKDAKGNPAGSGVYFYRLQAGKRVLTRKMVLLN